MKGLWFIALISGVFLVHTGASSTDDAAFEACARALVDINQSICAGAVPPKSPAAKNIFSALLRCHVSLVNSSTSFSPPISLRVLLPDALAPWLRPTLARFSALYDIPLSLDEQPPAQILRLAQLTAASMGGLPLPPITTGFTTPASAIPSGSTSTFTSMLPVPAVDAVAAVASDAVGTGPDATEVQTTAPTVVSVAVPSPPLSTPYDSPGSGVPAPYDVWLHPGAVTQLLADAGKLADMSYLVELLARRLAWQDIPRQLRLQLGTYRGAIVGIPYDSSTLLTMYRRDVLAELGLQVPATWTELLTFPTAYREARSTAVEGRRRRRRQRVLAENVTSTVAEGVDMGTVDLPEYPLCLPLGEGCSRVAYLQAIWSSLAQTRGSAQGGVHFHPTTLQPLLDGPAALEAAHTLAALLVAAAPPEQGEGCSHGAVGFARGSCALVLAGFVPQMALFVGPSTDHSAAGSGWLVPQGVVGVAPLPGSERVWLPQTEVAAAKAEALNSGIGREGEQEQGYVQAACTEATCPYATREGAAGEVGGAGSAEGSGSRLVNFAPLLLESTLVGSVSRRSPVLLQLLSFQLLAYLASPDRYQSSGAGDGPLVQAASTASSVNASSSDDVTGGGSSGSGGGGAGGTAAAGGGGSPPPPPASAVEPLPVVSVTPVRLQYIDGDNDAQLDVWVRAGYDRGLVAAALPVLSAAVQHRNLALGLRMAGAAYYNGLLDSFIWGLQNGTITAATTSPIASSSGATRFPPSLPLAAPHARPSPALPLAPAPTPVPKNSGAGEGGGGGRSRSLLTAAEVKPLSLAAALTAAQAAAEAYYQPEVFRPRYLASLRRPATIPKSLQDTSGEQVPVPSTSSSRTTVPASTAAAVSAAVGCGLLAAAVKILATAAGAGRRRRPLRVLAAAAARVRRRLLRAYPSSLGLRPRLPRLSYDISVSRHTQVTAPRAGSETAILVTDIQSSTRLWEELAADVMSAAVQLHHACIRRLVVEHAGYESATEGDSFILAFRSVKQAVAFALDLQMQLLVLPWPQELLKDEICMPLYTDLPDGFPLTNHHYNHHSWTHKPPEEERNPAASPCAACATSRSAAAYGRADAGGGGAAPSASPMPYDLSTSVPASEGPAAAGSLRPADLSLLRLSRIARRRDNVMYPQMASASQPASPAAAAAPPSSAVSIFMHSLPEAHLGARVNECGLGRCRLYSPRRSQRILETEVSGDGASIGTQRGWLRLRAVAEAAEAAGARLYDSVRRRWFRRAAAAEGPASVARRCDRLSVGGYGFAQWCIKDDTSGTVTSPGSGTTGLSYGGHIYNRTATCLHSPLRLVLEVPTGDSQRSRVGDVGGEQQNSSDSDGGARDEVFSDCCTAAAAALAPPSPSSRSITVATLTLAATVAAAARDEVEATPAAAAVQKQRSQSYSPPRRPRSSNRTPSRSSNPNTRAPPPPPPSIDPSPDVAAIPAALSSAGGSIASDFLYGGPLPSPPPGVTLGQLLGSLHRASFQTHEAEGRARRLLMFRGLRVRVGIHTGVSSSTAELQYNTAAARMVYGGPCVAACKMVADLAHGGQVFLSGAARMQLEEGVHGHNGGRPWGTLMLHIGTFARQPSPPTAPAAGASTTVPCPLHGSRSEILQPRRQLLAPLLPRAGSHGALRAMSVTPTIITPVIASRTTVAASPAVSAPGHAVYTTTTTTTTLVPATDASCISATNGPRRSLNLPVTESQLVLTSPSPPSGLASPTLHANGGATAAIAAATWRRPTSPPAATVVSARIAAVGAMTCTTGPLTAATPPPLSVYWLTSPTLAQRMALVPSPRLPPNLLPLTYVYDAPVGRVSYVVVQVPAAATLLAWDQRVASAALRLLADTAAAALRRVPRGGYLTSPAPGELCVAFSSALGAVRWAEGMRLELLEAPWSKALLQHELCEPLFVTDSESESDSGSISSSELSTAQDLLIATPASAMSAGGGGPTSTSAGPVISAGASGSGGCSRRLNGSFGGSCSSETLTLMSWRSRLSSGGPCSPTSSSHQFNPAVIQTSNQHKDHHHHQHHNSHHNSHHHHHHNHHHHNHHHDHTRPNQQPSKSLLLFGRPFSSRFSSASPPPTSGGFAAWISSRLNPGLQAAGFGFGGSGGGGTSPLRRLLTAGSSPPGSAAATAAASAARAAAFSDSDGAGGIVGIDGGGGTISAGCFPHVPSRLGLMHRGGPLNNASTPTRRRSIEVHCTTAPIVKVLSASASVRTSDATASATVRASEVSASAIVRTSDATASATVRASEVSASATVATLEATAAAASIGGSSSGVRPASVRYTHRSFGEPLPYTASAFPAAAIAVEVASWKKGEVCTSKGNSTYGSLRVGSPGAKLARHQFVRQESSLEVLPRVKAQALASNSAAVQPLFETSPDAVKDDDDGDAAEDLGAADSGSLVLLPDGNSTEGPQTSSDNETTTDPAFPTPVPAAAAAAATSEPPIHPPPRHHRPPSLSPAHPMMNCALELELCNGGVAGGVSRQVSKLASFLSYDTRDCTTPSEPPCWTRRSLRDCGTPCGRANADSPPTRGANAAGEVECTAGAAGNADSTCVSDSVSVENGNDNGNDRDTTNGCGGGCSGGDAGGDGGGDGGGQGRGSSGMAYRVVNHERSLGAQALDDILPKRLTPRGMPCEINYGSGGNGGGGGGDNGNGNGNGNGGNGDGSPGVGVGTGVDRKSGGGGRGVDSTRESACGDPSYPPRRLLLRGLRVRIGIATGTTSWSIADHTHDVSYSGRPVRQARRLAASFAASGRVLCCLVTCQEALATQASHDRSYDGVTSVGTLPSSPCPPNDVGDGATGPGVDRAAAFDAVLRVAFTPLRIGSGLQGMNRKSTVFVCGLYRAPHDDTSPVNTPTTTATTATPLPATAALGCEHDKPLGRPSTSTTHPTAPTPSPRPATTGGFKQHPPLNPRPLPYIFSWTSSPMPRAADSAPASTTVPVGAGPRAHVSASYPLLRPNTNLHIHTHTHMHPYTPPSQLPPPPPTQQPSIACAHESPVSTSTAAVSVASVRSPLCLVRQEMSSYQSTQPPPPPALDVGFSSQAAAVVREGGLYGLRATMPPMATGCQSGHRHARRGPRSVGQSLNERLGGLWTPPEEATEEAAAEEENEAERRIQHGPASSHQMPQIVYGRPGPYGSQLGGVSVKMMACLAAGDGDGDGADGGVMQRGLRAGSAEPQALPPTWPCDQHLDDGDVALGGLVHAES